MSFLPDDYTPPKENSNWLTIEDGETHNIRIMGHKDKPESFILGWLGFKDKNPIYKPYNESGHSEVYDYLNADKKPDDKKDLPIHFWTVAIFHEDWKRAMVWTIRQKTIQQFISSYMLEPDWGDPNNYILKVSRTGGKLSDTVYSVTPKSPNIAPPSEEILKIMEEAKIDCRVIFSGGQPMGALEETPKEPLSNIERLKETINPQE